MKSSDTFRTFPNPLLRRNLWLLPALGLFFLIGDEPTKSPEGAKEVNPPQAIDNAKEIVEKGSLSVKAPLQRTPLPESPAFQLESPHMDLSADQLEEWQVANGSLEGILRLEDGRRVVFSADSSAGDRYTVTSAAIAGEYVVRTAELPWQEWERTGLVGEGRIEVLQSNRYLTRLVVPSEDLEHIQQWEARLFRSVDEGLIGRNSLVYPSGTPNDPKYEGSWTLAKLDLEAVWEKYGFSPGAALGRRPVIAVVDSGASGSDYQMWTNEDEIPGNGVDDDGNGFIDDVSGWNFVRDSGDLSFSGGHGGRVAKIAASVTNNGKGTASPASSAALMRVIYFEKAAGTHFDALGGMIYAAINGADVINCSFVTDSDTLFSYAISQAEAAGSVVVAAAGNGNKSLDDDWKYPACSSGENLITVGASNEQDERQNSMYSATKVDIFAPAGATSFSTPLVSSTIALLRALKPDATPEEMIAAIVDGADPVPALEGLCRANGRLNVRGAVESLLGVSLSGEDPAPTPEEPVEPIAPVIAEASISGGDVHLAWSCPESVDGFEVQYSADGTEFASPEPTPVLDGSQKELLVENLPEGSEVVFRVRSFVGAAYSEWTLTHSFHIPVVYTGPEPVVEAPPVHEAAPGSPVVINPGGADGGQAAPVPEEPPSEREVEYSAPHLAEDGTLVVEVPDPAHFWDFEEGEGNRAADIGSHPMNLEVACANWCEGPLQGSAIVMEGTHEGLRIENSPTINLTPKKMLTIAFWVRPDEALADQTSLLYEQGSYTRGLNLILTEGRLQARGWNRPAEESAWEGTTLHGGHLLLGEWNHVAVVLEGGEALRTGGFRLFVNGKIADTGKGSQLWVDTGAIGLGQVQGTTAYNEQGIRSLHPFQGAFDDLVVWEAPLFGAQIEEFLLLCTE